ncbi:MAG TPA: FG-GAP-like repeat-containing protein [Patescibacteria group bacterium]|nr:FG-GAP-like repeat-containing protein [Patescibacteria group bacterium]
MGVFPRVVDADNDGLKDLLIGEAEGTLRLYGNINTDDDPRFDGGILLQVGFPGAKADIDVGQRPTPVVVDWNNDGRRDIVVGSKDGTVHLFINEGTDSDWDFRLERLVQEDGTDMIIPTLRASSEIVDMDNDGRKDLLTGNTEGQLLFYPNAGNDDAPVFSGYMQIESEGTAIDLPGALRSRPFVCDWDADGARDILLGYGDGLIRLYRGSNNLAGATAPPVRAEGLLPAYPNPFNPAVTIPFMLARNGRASLSIHDVSGRRVAVLVDGVLPAGRHETHWRGVDAGGRQLPSGIYFTRLRAGGIETTGKITLVR